MGVGCRVGSVGDSAGVDHSSAFVHRQPVPPAGEDMVVLVVAV